MDFHYAQSIIWYFLTDDNEEDILLDKQTSTPGLYYSSIRQTFLLINKYYSKYIHLFDKQQ